MASPTISFADIGKHLQEIAEFLKKGREVILIDHSREIGRIVPQKQPQKKKKYTIEDILKMEFPKTGDPYLSQKVDDVFVESV